jgi:hypothetical protein
MDGPLIGITGRTVTFGYADDQPNVLPRRFPAGTEVYVTVRRGLWTIRVPGTLWTQHVYPDAVRIP